jgi:hypothetical protein
MNPSTTIPDFDIFLAKRGLLLDAVVTGGTALALLGVISRETRDCDLIEPELASDLIEAAQSFASERRSRGEILRDDWLNNGPASLGPLLPTGWRERLQVIYQGQAIRLWSLGRSDLLKVKLWALCDRGLDLSDCLALRPDPGELVQAETWIASQDINPDWPAHVRGTLEDLARRLGHGL